MLGFAQAMISILRKDLVAYYCGSVAACSTFDLLFSRSPYYDRPALEHGHSMTTCLVRGMDMLWRSSLSPLIPVSG
jgi:hypothetical protein